MFRSLSALFAARRQPTARRSRLACEPLEARWQPATVGVTKQVVIDFDGEAQVTAAQFSQGGWSLPTQSVSSFRALFNSANPPIDLNGDGTINNTDRTLLINRLDMNGNGVVNSVDADLAVSRILAKVRQDFAPYRVSIVSGDQDTFQGMLTDFDVGDAMILVNGTGGGFVPGFANVFGVAPLDANNNSDEMGFVFGGNILRAASNPTDMVNRMARTISHETAHTFGLNHITNTTWSDAQTHHLMNAPVDVNGDGDTSDAGEDQRDFSRDFGFQDTTFNTDSGPQNAHEILSREDILGRSLSPWLAVLRPGQLTASGGSGSDSITVVRLNATQWRVTTNGINTTVDLNANGLSTLNMFDTAIGRVNVLGQGGNDTLTVNTNMTAAAFMDGGIGNDTMNGGNGNDTMNGGTGNDRMFGRGGDDRLFGNDGADRLDGGANDDRLDGGDDFANDTLIGGTGSDVFLQNLFIWPFTEETLVDVGAGDSVVNV
jgi:hypothetical protein